MTAGRAGGGHSDPVPDRADALWGHPERTIGARLDCVVRPLARPISFLGACFYKEPEIPEMRFQPIAIFAVMVGLIVVLFKVPLRDAWFVTPCFVLPLTWANGIAYRLAQAVPVPDERERETRRRGREYGLIAALAVCVCALFGTMMTLALCDEPARIHFLLVVLMELLTMLPVAFHVPRLLVIGWSAPHGGNEFGGDAI